MPATHKAKGNRRSSGNSRNISKRIQPKKTLPVNRISSRRRKSGNVSTLGIGFNNVINKSLAEKSIFSLQECSFLPKNNLLLVLKHLHKSLKRLPGYVDTKNWKQQPTGEELATHLFSEIKRVIPNSYNFHIGVPDNDDDLTIYYVKEANLGYDEYVPVPMEWLEDIEKANYSLFSLLIGVVAFINKRCGIDNYMTRFDDYIVGNPDAFIDFDEEDEQDFEAKKSFMQDLSKFDRPYGIVYRYIREGNDYLKYCTEDEIIEKIKNVSVYGRKQHAVKKWLQLAIPLLEGNEIKLSDYVLVTETDQYPLTVHDTYCFCWSIHSQITNMADEYRDADWNEVGYVGPVEYGMITDKKHIEPISASKLELIHKFFMAGNRMYFNHFDKKLKTKYDNRG